MLKEKLLSGQKIYGTMIRLSRNPGMMYLAKQAGFDYLMFDCEHSCYNFETLQDMFITGNALGLPSMVRVPELTKGYASRFLDFGAEGIMLPMGNTVAEAEELVKWTKYRPLGDRGYSTSCAHLDFKGASDHTQVMQEQNKRIITISQVETQQAVDNVEEIAAVPGIDGLLIGPNDLSISLGIPGDLANPIMTEAISHVVAACKKHHVAFGLHAGPALLKRFMDDLTIVMSETDISVLERGFRQAREAMTQ